MRRLMRHLGFPRWGWGQYALFVLLIFGLAVAAFVLTGALDEWRHRYDPLFYEPKDLQREDLDKIRKLLK